MMGNRVLALLGVVAISLPAASALAQTTEPCRQGVPDQAEQTINNMSELPSIPVNVPAISLSTAMSTAMQTIDNRFKQNGWNDVVREAYGDPLKRQQGFPVYQGMDLGADGKPIAETPAEIRGQNHWVRFSYGNQPFWHLASQLSGTTFDPLKTLDPREPDPNDPTQRLDNVDAQRFQRFGMIRTPGYRPMRDDNGKMLPNQFGLFLGVDKNDRWRNYKIDGMRGSAIENLILNPEDGTDPLDYATYGTQGPAMGWTYVFNPKFVKNITKKVDGEWVTEPNPLFDQDAVNHWDENLVEETFVLHGVPTQIKVARKFYGEAPRSLTNPDDIAAARDEAGRFAADRHLERPMMVGMSCGSCHIDINPVAMDPANKGMFLADPNYPEMKHLTSTRGRPNFVERSFVPNLPKGNILRQMEMFTRERGGNDTSFLTPQDHITNGDNDINPVHKLLSRILNAPTVKIYTDDEERWKLAGYLREQEGPLSDLYKGPILTEEGTGRHYIEVKAPRVLKSGGDTGVGAATGFARVSFNIGSAWMHVMSKANFAIGVIPQQPMSIKEVGENSPWVQTTWASLNDHVSFMLKAPSVTLDQTPTGRNILERDGAIDHAGNFTDKWARGRDIFASQCFGCHSAEQPGAQYGKDKIAAAQAFLAENIDDLRKTNHWSNEREVFGADVLKTSAARALGTNATEGNLWSNFSDDGALFKSRPQIGPVRAVDPQSLMNGEPRFYAFQNPDNGAGYYRSIDLSENWSHGAYGHGNNIGGGSLDPATDAMIQNAKTSTNIEDKYNWAKEAFNQLMNPDRRRGLASIPRTKGLTTMPIPEWIAPIALNRLAASEAMPWDGKSIDPASGWGVNRMRMPGKPGLTDMWFFKIAPGESKLQGGKTSLVLDYESPTCGEVRALVANPPSAFWANKSVPAYCNGRGDDEPANEGVIRKIHDEIVPLTVRTNTRPEGVTVFVGPAMAKRQGGVDEVLWFALSPTNDSEALDVLSGFTSDQLRAQYEAAGSATAEMLQNLAGAEGKPLGRMLSIKGVEQGETEGPLHDMLEQLGIGAIPNLELGPFPDGTPLALMNIKPEAIPGLLQKMAENNVLQRWQSLRNDPEGLKDYFVNTIVPAITPYLKAPVQAMDEGHYFGTGPGTGYTNDPNQTNVPWAAVDDPSTPEDERRGVLSDADKEALWAFISTL